jgi:hypothetical protein
LNLGQILEFLEQGFSGLFFGDHGPVQPLHGGVLLSHVALSLCLVEHLCERSDLALPRPQLVEQVVQELGFLADSRSVCRLALQDFAGSWLKEVDGGGPVPCPGRWSPG